MGQWLGKLQIIDQILLELTALGERVCTVLSVTQSLTSNLLRRISRRRHIAIYSPRLHMVN